MDKRTMTPNVVIMVNNVEKKLTITQIRRINLVFMKIKRKMILSRHLRLLRMFQKDIGLKSRD